MRKFFTFLLLLLSGWLPAQHTFSIVAVDPQTGEVGGAGATCYQTVNDIADVHPGVGFIHTQSYVNYDNQAYAKILMSNGNSPQQIMDSLQANDAENNPSIRQYAAVDLAGGGRSAAFTGNNCFSYKGQRLGPTFAIAGNILLGPQILDFMEAIFIRTQGTLADRLMAALQGAKIPGADSRCSDEGVSSLSAYMIVAKPTDAAPDFFLNLNVENVFPADPIDVLQDQYDNWKLTSVGGFSNNHIVNIYPNPSAGNKEITIAGSSAISEIRFLDFKGDTIFRKKANSHEETIDLRQLRPGLYMVELIGINREKYTRKLVIN